MKRYFYLFSCLLTFLAGCQTEIIPDEGVDNKNIHLTVGEVQTRGEVITINNLKSMAVSIYTHTEEGTDFAQGDIDSNDMKCFLTKVNKPDGASSNRGWVFENPEHGKWDKTKNYHSFWAFAPADFDFSVRGIYTYDAEYGFRPRLVVRDLPVDISQQKDILYSEKKNTMHYYLGNKSVPLDFRHVLSRITFQFKATGLVSGESVKISSVQLLKIFRTVTVYPAQNTYYEWDSQSKKDYIIPYGDVSINASASPVANKTNTCFMCPQKQLNAFGTKIIVSYKYKSAGMTTEESRTAELDFPAGSQWDIGKAYNYIITDPHKPSVTISVTHPEWLDQVIDEDITGQYFKLPKKTFYHSDIDFTNPGTNPNGKLSIDIDSDYTIDQVEMLHDVDANYNLTLGHDPVNQTINNVVIDFNSIPNKNLKLGFKCKNKNNETYTTTFLQLRLKHIDYTSASTARELGVRERDNQMVYSNCYIISPEISQTIYIPVAARMNYFWRDHATPALTEDILPLSTDWLHDDRYTVDIMWHDGISINGLVIAKAIRSASSENDRFAISVNVPNDIEYQNVGIAVRRDGKIIWSWHLWVTNYWPYNITPSTTLNVAQRITGGEVHRYSNATGVSLWGNSEIYSDKFIMDRCVGAKAVTAPATLFGDGSLYYQFGRKDPMSGPGTTFLSCKRSIVNSPRSFVYSVEHPTHFISAGTNGNWSEDEGAQLNNVVWNQKGLLLSDLSAKSIFDPSPYGWRLPLKGTFDVFSSRNVSYNSEEGSYVYNGVSSSRFFPLGYLSFGGQFQRPETDTYMWTASPDNTIERATSVVFIRPSGSTENVIIPTNQNLRTVGMSIRPIQESK